MGAAQSQPAAPAEITPEQDKKHKLGADDLDALSLFITSAHLRWRDMGRTLGFKHTELSDIVPKPGLTTQNDYFVEMLSLYLKWAPPNKPQPSTEDIIAALRGVGEHSLALKLEQDTTNFMANTRLR